MVDSLAAENAPECRQEFHNRLRMRVKTAAACVNRSAPTLLIMHGPSGSGKSWLSERLVMQMGAVRIRSDVERKRLGGVQPSVVQDIGLERGLYSPELSHRTYARLLECAESCLHGAVDTIVDAAFLNGADRRLFSDLAVRKGSRFMIVQCEADRMARVERVEKRAQLRKDPSDADVAVLNRQMQNAEPLSADERAHAIVVDTAEPGAYQSAFAAIQDRRASPMDEPAGPIGHRIGA